MEKAFYKKKKIRSVFGHGISCRKQYGDQIGRIKFGDGGAQQRHFLFQGGENKQGQRSCKEKKTSEKIAKERFKGKEALRRYV